MIPQGPISKPAPWNQPAQTQDSQKDSTHIEKTNNFVNWLHDTKEKAIDKLKFEEDIAGIKSGMYQIGGEYNQEDPTMDKLRKLLEPKKTDPSKSGYETGNYGHKKDINLGYFQAATANMSEPMEHIAGIASGLNAMKGSSPKFNFNPGSNVAKDVAANPPTQPVFSDTERSYVTPEDKDAFPEQGKIVDPNPPQSDWYTDPTDWGMSTPIDRPPLAYGGDIPTYAPGGDVEGVAVKGNTGHDTIEVPINKRNLSEHAQDVDYKKYPWLKGTPKYDTDNVSTLSSTDKWTRGAVSKMEGYRTKMKDARAAVHKAYGIDQSSWEDNPNLELDRFKTNEAGERLISDEIWGDISTGLDAEKAYQRKMGFKEFDVRGKKQVESNVPMDVASGSLAAGRRYTTGWAPGYEKKVAGAPAVIDKVFDNTKFTANLAKPEGRRPYPGATPSFEYGGGMMYAQDGVSFPGYGVYNPDELIKQQKNNQPISEDQYQTATDYNADKQVQNTFEQYTPKAFQDPIGAASGKYDPQLMAPGEGVLQNNTATDPFDKSSDGIPNSGFGSNPMNSFGKSNAEHQNQAQGAIATMKGITGLAGYADKRKREKEIKNRMSDVFETHDIQGSDRGDYMANAPGVGGNFRPDELTRMGYNTKIAQEGGSLPDENMYMTEAQAIDQARRAAFIDPAQMELVNQWKKMMIDPGADQIARPRPQMMQIDPQTGTSYNQQFDNAKPQEIRRQQGGEPTRTERRFNKEVAADESNNWGNNELDWIKNSMAQDKRPFSSYHKEMAYTAPGRSINPLSEYKKGDEAVLSKTKIAELIEQGYELEYLD